MNYKQKKVIFIQCLQRVLYVHARRVLSIIRAWFLFYVKHVLQYVNGHAGVLQLCKVSQNSNKPFRRSCAYKVHDPSFRESISWIISPFKFWTATIFRHAHLQLVYYKCVKFHKNPISRLGGVALTRYMDARTDGRTGWFLYTPQTLFAGGGGGGGGGIITVRDIDRNYKNVHGNEKKNMGKKSVYILFRR